MRILHTRMRRGGLPVCAAESTERRARCAGDSLEMQARAKEEEMRLRAEEKRAAQGFGGIRYRARAVSVCCYLSASASSSADELPDLP